MYRITAKQILLGNRVDPLLFGYFAWPDTDEKRTIKEAGSGMFVAPRLGISARHVAKSFEKFDPQFDALNRRKTPLDPQYQMKPVVCDFGSMIYQATESKPNPEGEDQILWKPLTGFGSFDTDIVTVLVEPRTRAAREIEAEQRYFEWQLLPPPVGSLVSIYGLPEQRIEVQAENHAVGADVWWWNARVDSHRRFYAHGFGDFPVFELHRELPGGFSGAPVFYNGRLASLHWSRTRRLSLAVSSAHVLRHSRTRILIRRSFRYRVHYGLGLGRSEGSRGTCAMYRGRRGTRRRTMLEDSCDAALIRALRFVPQQTPAAQLRVAADERPFAGPALTRLLHRNLHGVTAAADRVLVNGGSRRAALPLARGGRSQLNAWYVRRIAPTYRNVHASPTPPPTRGQACSRAVPDEIDLRRTSPIPLLL